jgi:cell division protein FtsI (penicillin-binding protein 3)
MNTAYKLRSSLIFLFFCSLYIIILFNLYSIAIKQRNFFINLAKQQYSISVTSTPERALIYDRNGAPLVLNKPMLSAFMLPKTLESKETLEPFLKRYFPQALERLHQHPDSHFLYIKRKLSPEHLALLEQHNVLDIKLLKEPGRFYPIESAGPLVGITDIDNVGLFGLELIYDKLLGGSPTTFYLEKDARSGHFYFTKTTKREGIAGKPITLTIDADLQFLAFEHLKNTITYFNAQEGAVLIMEPTSGEIIAMTQWPTFDPNNTSKLAIEHTKNTMATNVYELGSVMKVFTALAALEEGVVTPDELIDCEHKKTTYINGIKVNTVYEDGIIPFSEVIQRSNNIGIAKVAQRLDHKLYEHYKRLGFGKKTGLSWPGEQKGFINPPQNWSRQSIISLSFGYEITASLLQLARAFCIIANNGYLVTPHILAHADMQNLKEEIKPLYSQESLNTMHDILEKTVTQGTAKRAAMKGYTVMGKTGTANVLIDGIYNPNHNIYTFAGIIEKGSYKRVIVTFIKDAAQKNLYASTVAVPLFERIAENVLIHDKIL